MNISAKDALSARWVQLGAITTVHKDVEPLLEQAGERITELRAATRKAARIEREYIEATLNQPKNQS